MDSLFHIGFLSVTIFDILDILLVTLLCFMMYKALKNTIAIQILFGMIVIIALTFVSGTLNLKTTNWILKTVLNIWLLSFVILFQPEIRKMLLMVTRYKFLNLFVKSELGGSLDEIIEAVRDMASRHIGALIVISRKQNVQMTVETGVLLQSVISKELLLSIFNTKSPLHDGAVIIDNNLIVAAKCILPLSNQIRHQKKVLGTRHRAGLGLSEKLDAVIIIISEETGAISLAQHGELIYNIPSDKIQTVLNNKVKE